MFAQDCTCDDYCERCSAEFNLSVVCNDEEFMNVTTRDLITKSEFVPVCAACGGDVVFAPAQARTHIRTRMLGHGRAPLLHPQIVDE